MKIINKLKKALIGGALLLSTIFCFSQPNQYNPYSRDKEKQDVVEMIMFSFLETALDATGDALMDEGYKQWGHAFNAATIATFVIEPGCVRYDNWEKVGMKALVLTGTRFLMFDMIYNGMRGLPLDYHGTTSQYDLFWRNYGNGGFMIKSGFYLVTIHFTFRNWD